MKKDVLLIAHFCSDFDGKGNNRFNYLADLITESGISIEFVTSDFSHNKKAKRKKMQFKEVQYKITYIEEPGYTKNVSLKRFYSHYVMSRNIKKYLDNRKVPDVIYCAVPSLDVAKVASQYAKKNNIRFIIDVQDLWPEAFKMVFRIPLISDLLFYPMEKQANLIYSSADEIVAVSETYINRVLKSSKKVFSGYSVFLGTDLVVFDSLKKLYKYEDKYKDEIKVAYVGTLGHSYDLTVVMDAMEILRNKGISNIRFIVMGDGPLRVRFEEYSIKKKLNVEFTGMLSYGEMVGRLSGCDIAVNPISYGAAQSIINKVADYAAAGLPVINTQECEEYRKIIDNYKSGMNCINNDSSDFADKLLLLYSNKELRKSMGINSRRLAEEKFDRSKTYRTIIELL